MLKKLATSEREVSVQEKGKSYFFCVPAQAYFNVLSKTCYNTQVYPRAGPFLAASNGRHSVE